jgi:hypothetical protein
VQLRSALLIMGATWLLTMAVLGWRHPRARLNTTLSTFSLGLPLVLSALLLEHDGWLILAPAAGAAGVLGVFLARDRFKPLSGGRETQTPAQPNVFALSLWRKVTAAFGALVAACGLLAFGALPLAGVMFFAGFCLGLLALLT